MQIAEKEINNDDEIIVSYCDYGTLWNYEEFKKDVKKYNLDGAIPSYIGFHPHMLGSDNYAFIREENKNFLEIQEKKPFTENKMNEYAQSFDVSLNVIEMAKLPHQYFDVIINATSASLNDANLNLDNKIFHESSLAYDMMYGKETTFIKQAKSQASQTSDGLGMLVEQAAEAFYIWHHIKPQTKTVIALLRKN